MDPPRPGFGGRGFFVPDPFWFSTSQLGVPRKRAYWPLSIKLVERWSLLNFRLAPFDVAEVTVEASRRATVPLEGVVRGMGGVCQHRHDTFSSFRHRANATTMMLASCYQMRKLHSLMRQHSLKS